MNYFIRYDNAPSKMQGQIVLEAEPPIYTNQPVQSYPGIKSLHSGVGDLEIGVSNKKKTYKVNRFQFFWGWLNVFICVVNYDNWLPSIVLTLI